MADARVAVLISGSGSNMVALVKAMQAGGMSAAPCLVLSNRPDAGGLAKAEQLDVPTSAVDHRAFSNRADFESKLTTTLEQFTPDVVCLAGFMRILGTDFVERWKGKMLNIHPSLLPLYPGLNTHARSLAAKDTEHGCTVHEVTAGLDAGPILGQARVPVLEGDTEDTLAARVLIEEHKLYPQVLARFVAGVRTPLILS